MQKLKQVLQKKERSQAYVVDGKLVLSLTGSINPIVWQMDLGTTKASALEIVEEKGGKSYTLMLKPLKGETFAIAPFHSKADALEALKAASAAMASAQGKIRSASEPGENGNTKAYSAPPRKARKHWIISVLIIAAIVFLIGYIGMLTPRAPQGIQGGAQISPVAGGAAPQGNAAAGVPMSADAYLRGQ